MDKRDLLLLLSIRRDTLEHRRRVCQENGAVIQAKMYEAKIEEIEHLLEILGLEG